MMPITTVQSVQSVRAVGVGSASVVITGVRHDSMLVVCSAVLNLGGSEVTVSDDVNPGDYAPGGAIAVDGSSQLFQHYKKGSLGGSITVTVNPNGAATTIDFTVTEVVSTDPTAPLEQAVTNTGALGAGAATATVTTAPLSIPDVLVVAVASHTGDNRTLTADANFTIIGENEDNTTGQAFLSELRRCGEVGATKAAVTATCAIGAGVDTGSWFILACVYRAKHKLHLPTTHRPRPFAPGLAR